MTKGPLDGCSAQKMERDLQKAVGQSLAPTPTPSGQKSVLYTLV